MKKKIFSVTLISMAIQEILQFLTFLRWVISFRTDESSLYLNGECGGVMSHFWAKFESKEKRIFIRMRKFSRGSRSPEINEQEKGNFLASHWSIFPIFFRENFSKKYFPKNKNQKNSKRKNPKKKFANVQPNKLSISIDQRKMCTSGCL